MQETGSNGGIDISKIAKWAGIALVVLLFIMVPKWCSNTSSIGGSGVSSVESLYGTYIGTDNNGHKVKIVLKAESDNEWRKYGEDWSDNLVFKDSKGKIQNMDWQRITWTWNLNDGYVKTYYIGRTGGGERTIIDIKGGKMYHSWGEYLDKRNGFKYTKH